MESTANLENYAVNCPLIGYVYRHEHQNYFYHSPLIPRLLFGNEKERGKSSIDDAFFLLTLGNLKSSCCIPLELHNIQICNEFEADFARIVNDGVLAQVQFVMPEEHTTPVTAIVKTRKVTHSLATHLIKVSILSCRHV